MTRSVIAHPLAALVNKVREAMLRATCWQLLDFSRDRFPTIRDTNTREWTTPLARPRLARPSGTQRIRNIIRAIRKPIARNCVPHEFLLVLK